MVVGPGMVGGGGEIRDCQVLLLFFFFFPTNTILSLSQCVGLPPSSPGVLAGGLCQILLPSPRPPPPPADGRKGEKQKSGRLMGQKCGWALLTWEPVPLYGSGGVVLIAVVLSMYYPGWVFVENVSFVVAGSVVVKYSLF